MRSPPQDHSKSVNRRAINEIRIGPTLFYHSPAQQAAAEQLIKELMAQKAYADPIVTDLAPAQTFYVAEGCHQEYFANNGYQPYCQFVVAPKVAKFRKKFAAKVK